MKLNMMQISSFIYSELWRRLLLDILDYAPPFCRGLIKNRYVDPYLSNVNQEEQELSCAYEAKCYARGCKRLTPLC